jgi:hypothetical protein
MVRWATPCIVLKKVYLTDFASKPTPLERMSEGYAVYAMRNRMPELKSLYRTVVNHSILAIIYANYGNL